MKEITLLTDDDLAKIQHYAELRYSLTEIAAMLCIDVGQLRIAIQNPKSDVSLAYNSGKLISSVNRREAILKAANNGNEWAIKLLDGYGIDQKEDELMP